MLEVKGIVKYYKKTKGVENLSFKLDKGKALGIIGLNGSGKTTTFRVLLGLLKADSGSMLFNNKDISKHPVTLLGYLPEERSLYKDLTVYDQLMFLGRLKNLNNETIVKRLDRYLKLLRIPKYKYTRIEKLSKGNQQKVQIICALIHNPSVLILDEPLSGLDIINVELLKNLIKKLKNEGKYILLSSHQFEHIEEFCDDIIILKDGDVMYSGNIQELINLSEHYYLSIDKEVGLKFVDRDCIIDSKVNGKLINFKINNKQQLNSLFREIVKTEKFKNISIEEASIEEVVKELNLV